jgi:hypothetical protein
MLPRYDLIFEGLDNLIVGVLLHPGSTYNNGNDLSCVKADRVWYRVSDKDVQKVPVSVTHAQKSYMLV